MKSSCWLEIAAGTACKTFLSNLYPHQISTANFAEGGCRPSSCKKTTIHLLGDKLYFVSSTISKPVLSFLLNSDICMAHGYWTGAKNQGVLSLQNISRHWFILKIHVGFEQLVFLQIICEVKDFSLKESSENS